MNEINLRPRIYVPRVTRRPFQAEFIITSQTTDGAALKGVEATRGTMYRNFAGDLRTEFAAKGPDGSPMRMAMLEFHPSGRLVVLELTNRLIVVDSEVDAVWDPSLGTQSGTGWTFFDADLKPVEEFREIEGVRCQRYLARGLDSTGRPAEDAGDLWWSEDLQHTVLDQVIEAGQKRIYRLLKIRRAEPEASLFTIPKGFSKAALGRDAGGRGLP